MSTLKELSIELKIDPTSAVKGIRAVDAETKQLIADTKRLDEATDAAAKSQAQGIKDATRLVRAAKKELRDQKDLQNQVFDDAAKKTKELSDARKKSESEASDRSAKRRASLKDELSGIAGFGAGVAQSIAVGVAALAGSSALAGKFVADWAHGAVEIDRTAKQFGLSAQALQEWQFAAKATGGEAESIGEIFKELSIRITEVAETGAGPATDALSLLKLKAEDLKKLKPEQQMEVLADRISKVADAGTRFFLKDSLFGEEGGIKVGNLLEEGAAGIAKLRAEAAALGGVLGGEAIAKAKSFNKEMARVDEVAKGIKTTIATALLPVVKDVIDKVSKWAIANKDLIATKVEAFAKSVADAAAKLGPIFADAMSVLIKLTGEVGGLGNALAIGATAWGAWQLAALASMGAVGQGFAVLMAGIAAGAGLANLIKGAAGGTKQKHIASDEASATATFRQFSDRAMAENTGETTGSPEIDLMRARFIDSVAVASRGQEFVSSGQGRSEAQIGDRNRLTALMSSSLSALDAAYAEDAAHAAEVAGTDPGFALGRIAKPGSGKGGPKVASLAGLTGEESKRRADTERLSAIRLEAERELTTAEGPRRAILESVIGGLNKQIGGPSRGSIAELLANEVGQTSGIGAAGLRPAGLGTSINNIDASITINVGGVDVTVPAAALRTGDPMGSGREFGGSIMDTLKSVFEDASRLQRAQING